MLPAIAKLPATYRKYGAREFTTRAFRQLRRLLSYRHYYDSYFDRRCNVNTSMIVQVFDLAYADLQIQQHAKEHYPSPPYKVMRALQLLKRQMGGFDDAAFVDYGCGAGRAMIIAAEAGFTHIIGIELSPKLLGVCKENIARYASRNKAANLVVIEQDATTYVPDKSSNVFFFYVPFSPEAYNKALANIALSLERNPRTIYLLDFAWSKIDFSDTNYERIGQVEGINLYRLTAQ